MKMTLSGFVAKYSSEISFLQSYIFWHRPIFCCKLFLSVQRPEASRMFGELGGSNGIVDPGCLNVHIGLSPEFFQRMHLLHSRHIWTLEEKGHNFILFIEDNHIFLTYEFFKQHSCYIANKEKTEPVIHMHLHGSLVKWISEF